ncbi:MAG: alpha/beta fold hydrolase [Planctomycetes bacterium]|nr:alpha/beta fold hydrolase [Planctomycetota bacterium]
MPSTRTTDRVFPEFLLPALLAIAGPLVAQDTAPAAPALQRGEVQVRTHELAGAEREIEYALFVPSSYDAEKPAPLVVLLHGLGSNPRQVMGYRGVTTEAEERGYVVVAPFGYNERGWYGSRGPGKEGPYFGRPEDPDNLGELSERDVLRVLEIVREDLRIDPDRIFLMGHSMGGAGTIYLGATHRDLFAGLAPLAPASGGSMDVLAGLGTTPVFVVAGDQDRLVRFELVRRWVDEMRRLEVPVRFEVIEGGDHVRSFARNPEMIGRVFDFFDGLRKGAPPADPAAPGTAPEPVAPGDPQPGGSGGPTRR